MKSLWNDKEAKNYANDDLQLRVYTSRLLGRDPSLVLHGGGNTSVKLQRKNILGEDEDLLCVKGSGWDLASIQAEGFSPVKLAPLQKAVRLEHLSDTDMVRLQLSSLTDASLPSPSVEAILHAIIPRRFVDHTHADAVVTLSNTPRGEKIIRELFKEKILIVPYTMPGFVLAKKIHALTQSLDWDRLEGIILLQHGVFSFADDAKSSYERMIHIVDRAETYLQQHAKVKFPAAKAKAESLLDLTRIRQAVSQAKGNTVIAKLDPSPEILYFVNQPQALEMASRGPLTPDHVIRTKPFPVLISNDPYADVKKYVESYKSYFKRNAREGMTCLNPAPCWALWPGHGTISFGSTLKEANIIADIQAHTLQAVQRAESLDGWRPLPEKDIFALEYWELEQAKLKKSAIKPEFQGKVALITGAASGIGQACVKALHAQGAAVAALDINPKIQGKFQAPDILELVCDVTRSESLKAAVEDTIRKFGGLDILLSNAGNFPAGQTLAELNSGTWEKSLELNLTSHQQLLKLAIPFLSHGIDPAVVIVASRNVPAPGPGAAAYSVAKAGLTQLARIAALELGPRGIRVNVVHPHAVFDTSIWTPGVLEQRAKQYGMTVAEYKANNLLKTEIKAEDVARLVCALAGPAFAKTTGAQIPIDGGNERVI